MKKAPPSCPKSTNPNLVNTVKNSLSQTGLIKGSVKKLVKNSQAVRERGLIKNAES